LAALRLRSSCCYTIDQLTSRRHLPHPKAPPWREILASTAGHVPPGPVVVFDFDNYYMAGAIAEQLAKQGSDVAYVTTAGNASAWTFMTNELPLVHRALRKAGVGIHTLSV
jgi:hypothetical protein